MTWGVTKKVTNMSLTRKKTEAEELIHVNNRVPLYEMARKSAIAELLRQRENTLDSDEFQAATCLKRGY